MKTRKAVVIIDDNILMLLKKGELVLDYYNPGRLFNRISLITFNNPMVTVDKIRDFFSDEICSITNIQFPKMMFFITLGHNVLIMKIIFFLYALQYSFNDDLLIRTYGNRYASFLGAVLSKRKRIPMVMSIHENFLTDYRFRVNSNLARYLYTNSFKSIALYAIQHASHIFVVYKSIEESISKYRTEKVTVLYNMTNTISNESEFQVVNSSKNVFKLLWIGNLIEVKNPVDIIHAVSLLPNVTFTIIGKGPLKKRLLLLVSKLQLSERVVFLESISNYQVVNTMKLFDLFVVNVKGVGIPKTVIEAFKSELPVIINEVDRSVSEYQMGAVHIVEDSVLGYYKGIKLLMENEVLRENYASIAKSFVNIHMDNDKILALYLRTLKDLIHE